MQVLNGDEGLECEICIDGIRLEHVTEFHVHMENFRGLLGVTRMDRIPNARIRELCGVEREGSCTYLVLTSLRLVLQT